MIGHMPEDKQLAREICASCPALADCSEYALTAEGRQVPGILAGKTSVERRPICKTCSVELPFGGNAGPFKLAPNHCKRHASNKNNARLDWASA